MVAGHDADGLALARSELVGLFDRMADGVYVVDPGQRIVYWNEAAEQITGAQRGGVLGRLCCEYRPGT